jgi:hypothetical protein
MLALSCSLVRDETVLDVSAYAVIELPHKRLKIAVAKGLNLN